MEYNLFPLWGMILKVGSYGPYCRLLKLTGVRLLLFSPSDLLSLPLASWNKSTEKDTQHLAIYIKIVHTQTRTQFRVLLGGGRCPHRLVDFTLMSQAGTPVPCQ